MLQIGNSWIAKIFLSALVGVFAGLSATLFLILLDWVTHLRSAYHHLLWGLPFVGMFIGWVYSRFGAGSDRGSNFILDEIHEPKNVLPLRMAPLVLGGTLLTHLCGGSAGREGTAVQMGATLADQLGKYFKINSAHRSALLMAGAGAGFGAAIGTPIAGIVFGMEVSQVGKLKYKAWLECSIASLMAWLTTLVLKTPHTQFLKAVVPNFSFQLIVWIVVASILFGLTARIFSLASHFCDHWFKKIFPSPILKPFVGGLALLALFQLPEAIRYAGLGIPVIQEALGSGSSFMDPILKAGFTILTLASGFKGGEFIPLVFIGATLGSAISSVLPVSVSLLSSLGFAAVFGSAAKTPIACTIMAIEIFGLDVGPYALLSCVVAFLVSGRKGIYLSQR